MQFISSRRWRYRRAFCGKGILKLFTAKAAKKFREVREEARALRNGSTTWDHPQVSENICAPSGI
jgi:hypothetical protein